MFYNSLPPPRPLRKLCRLWDNLARPHRNVTGCMRNGCWITGYKHTLITYNNYCFSTPIMATRTRLIAMFYVHCLPRCVLYACGCTYAQKTLGCHSMQNPETRVWNFSYLDFLSYRTRAPFLASLATAFVIFNVLTLMDCKVHLCCHHSGRIGKFPNSNTMTVYSTTIGQALYDHAMNCC